MNMLNLLLEEVLRYEYSLLCDAEKEERTIDFCEKYEYILKYNKSILLIRFKLIIINKKRFEIQHCFFVRRGFKI